MDPIAETVLWGVGWFFAGSLGAVLIYALAFGVGILVSDEDEGPFMVAVFFGWILALLWEAFVVYQVIMHIIALIGLLTA